MLIFIISSDARTIRFLTGAVAAYSEQKYVEAEVKSFQKMKDYLSNTEEPDLIFVDDNVEMRPSVENAKLIRGKDGKVAIVLLSSNPERVFDAFRVRAHRFLTKPIIRADIFDAIDSYRKDLVTYRVIIAKVHEGFRIFTSEEVYALVADGNHTQLITAEETVDTLSSFAKIEDQLPKEYFYKCHRAYVVNMKHIATLSQEELSLTNGTVIPISRRRKLDFHVRYAEFVKGHTFKD
ncbi:MAG: response regulator transcription factor [Clostridia bacterium]|nr:response regulator transcription factor [Clostridia bacterium]MBR1705050.1 response regulator transcription factor [Clostridia bacterium]